MTTPAPQTALPHRVAFLGLGVMGYPMAGHLARAGHEVTVYNRSPEKAARWIAEHPGRSAATPAQAADGAQLVCSCVGNDDDLRMIAAGEHGALRAMAPGTLFVDHTTASARVAVELAALAQPLGVEFIDAPVSGGQAGAQAGSLAVMCGGAQHAVERARPVLAAYARSIRHIGASGSGQLAKMVNQLCIAGIIQGLAEGLHFGERAGLDLARVLEAIGQGAAQSWQMDHRAPTMIEGRYDFGFAVDWMRKDLSLCLEEARRNGASLPVAALVDQLYAEVQRLGGSRWDTSSLIERLRRTAPDA